MRHFTLHHHEKFKKNSTFALSLTHFYIFNGLTNEWECYVGAKMK